MVGDVVVVAAADYCVHHLNVAREHLIKMSTLAMGFSTTIDRRRKITVSECCADFNYVVVEVTTDNDGSVSILLCDVLADLHDSFCSIFEFLLLPWLQVAVEYLHNVATDLQLCPAQMGPDGLHQRQLSIRQ